MRAEERPPKKAAITSLNRSSGTGPTSIHTADSDQQSNLNEALQVDPCSVVQTFANIMGGGEEEPAGAELQLEIEGSSAMKLRRL
jgi:hypothetical protein